MKDFYISFGQAHAHAISGKTFDKDCICVIETQTETEARKKAFELFDDQWCFIYEEKPEMVYFPRGLITI